MELKVYEGAGCMPGYGVSGFIFNDTRGKFADGTLVTTSTVQEIKNGKIYTKSGSMYNLTWVSLEEWTELTRNSEK